MIFGAARGVIKNARIVSTGLGAFTPRRPVRSFTIPSWLETTKGFVGILKEQGKNLHWNVAPPIFFRQEEGVFLSAPRFFSKRGWALNLFHSQKWEEWPFCGLGKNFRFWKSGMDLGGPPVANLSTVSF